MARRKDPAIPDAILDQLLAGADAKTAFDQNGLLDQLKKALTERALKAELDHHLAGDESGNRRNGYGHKTVLTEGGSMGLSIPRDRTGTFDPALIGKYQRRFPGFDEKIVSMYARGMSTREITGHLRAPVALRARRQTLQHNPRSRLHRLARGGRHRSQHRGYSPLASQVDNTVRCYLPVLRTFADLAPHLVGDRMQECLCIGGADQAVAHALDRP